MSMRDRAGLPGVMSGRWLGVVWAAMNLAAWPAIAADNGAAGPAAADSDAEVAARPARECDADELPALRSTWRGTLWTNGVVPYEFNANATPTMRAQMCEAMDELHTVCGVRFVPRTSEANFIFIQNSTGNNSFVGMIGGSQTVNIFNWNFKYIMAHELMHALGEMHEQSRPDRGTFVQINAANICQDCCSGNPCNGNFNISTSSTTVGAYDFESVMHYGATAFSVNGQPTIQCIAPYTAFQSVIGNRSFLSVLDQAGLVSKYGPAIDDAFEPNDTRATAMAVGGTSLNLILNDRDDYLRVRLPAGTQSISVVGWPAAVSEGGRLWLYTLSGSVLASPLMTAGPGPGETSASITANVANTEYVVRVSRSCGQGGAYQLTLPHVCRADFNASGTSSVQDVFDFLASYFAAEFPRADFNNSGVISVQDVFDFLAEYFSCV